MISVSGSPDFFVSGTPIIKEVWKSRKSGNTEIPEMQKSGNSEILRSFMYVCRQTNMNVSLFVCLYQA